MPISKTTTVPFAKRYRAPVEYRFWIYVDKNGPIHPVCGQCWMWTGGFYTSGYGQLGNSPYKRAHRYSYALNVGEIPKGIRVLHHCDNPGCVNPAHLFLGTDQDNKADCVAKNRQTKGSDHHSSKLTEEIVRTIRLRFDNRKMKKRDPVDGIKALAEEFGVSRPVIVGIVNRASWKHVKE